MPTRFLASGLLAAAVAVCGNTSGLPSVCGTGADPDTPSGPIVKVTSEQREKQLRNFMRVAQAVHGVMAEPDGGAPADILGADGKPLLSWRVRVIQAFTHDNNKSFELYQKFKLTEAWDSPHNKALLKQMPDAFTLPGREAPPGHTYYQTFIGPKDVDPKSRPWLKQGDRYGAPILKLPDGLLGTLMLVEAAEAVPWTKPADLPFDGKSPLPKLGGHAPNRFLAAYADAGVVVMDRSKIDDATLRALITVAGGEKIDKKYKQP